MIGNLKAQIYGRIKVTIRHFKVQNFWYYKQCTGKFVGKIFGRQFILSKILHLEISGTLFILPEILYLENCDSYFYSTRNFCQISGTRNFREFHP